MKRYSVLAALLTVVLGVPAAVLGADANSLSAQTGPNPGQVTLKWNHATADVQNYNIVYGTEPGHFQYGAVGIGKTTSYVVSFLRPGQEYFFAISPVRAGKGQPFSTQASANAQSGVVDQSPVVAAAGPLGLSAKPGDKPGEVILSWNPAITDADNYNVVYGTEPGKFQYGALNVGKVSSFKVKSLNPGQQYYFALAPAKGGRAQYVTSQVVAEAKPGVVVPETPAVATAFTAANVPQLEVKKGKAGEAVLEWKHNSTDTDNYDVVYGTEPGKFQYGALNVGKEKSFTVKGLDPKKHYYFAIAPVKGGQAQYITAPVTDAGTAAAANSGSNSNSNASSNSGGSSTNIGSAGSGSSGGSTSGGSGASSGNTSPAVAAPAQTSGGTSSSGTSGSSGSSSNTNTGGGSKKEDKKSDNKDDKKSKVKGTDTSAPSWLEALKAFFRSL